METAASPRLHPVLLIAALSVTAFSLAGIGVLIGLIPWQGPSATPLGIVSPAPAVVVPTNETAPAASPSVSPSTVPPAVSPQPAVIKIVTEHQASNPSRKVARSEATEIPLSKAETLRESPRDLPPIAQSAPPWDYEAPQIRESSGFPPPPVQPPLAQPALGVQPLSAPPICRDCGWIESVQAIERPGDASGLGAVAGGVLGGAVGNQIGKGNGNKLATIAGVLGGAYAGHQIEKSQRKAKHYEITVRMEDGTATLVRSETPPAYAVGQRVRVVGGTLAPER